MWIWEGLEEEKEEPAPKQRGVGRVGGKGEEVGFGGWVALTAPQPLTIWEANIDNLGDWVCGQTPEMTSGYLAKRPSLWR